MRNLVRSTVAGMLCVIALTGVADAKEQKHTLSGPRPVCSDLVSMQAEVEGQVSIDLLMFSTDVAPGCIMIDDATDVAFDYIDHLEVHGTSIIGHLVGGATKDEYVLMAFVHDQINT